MMPISESRAIHPLKGMPYTRPSFHDEQRDITFYYETSDNCLSDSGFNAAGVKMPKFNKSCKTQLYQLFSNFMLAMKFCGLFYEENDGSFDNHEKGKLWNFRKLYCALTVIFNWFYVLEDSFLIILAVVHKEKINEFSLVVVLYAWMIQNAITGSWFFFICSGRHLYTGFFDMWECVILNEHERAEADVYIRKRCKITLTICVTFTLTNLIGKYIANMAKKWHWSLFVSG